MPVFRREGDGSRPIKRTMMAVPSRGRGCACLYPKTIIRGCTWQAFYRQRLPSPRLLTRLPPPPTHIYSRGKGQSIGPLPSSRPLRDRGFHYLPRQCRNAPSLDAVTSFCRLHICSNEAHPHVDNARWIELLYRFWSIIKNRIALCL